MPNSSALATWVQQDKFVYSDPPAECFTCYLRPVAAHGPKGIYFGQVDPFSQKRQGRGVYINSSIYEGYWAAGLYNGSGRLINKQGQVYKGTFKNGSYYNGKEVGNGYNGSWVDGQRSG